MNIYFLYIIYTFFFKDEQLMGENKNAKAGHKQENEHQQKKVALQPKNIFLLRIISNNAGLVRQQRFTV